MRRNTRVRLVTAAVSVAGALSLAACQGQGGSSGATGSTGSASSTFVMVEQPSGPLTRNFNPFNTSNAGYVQGTQALVYEPLVQFNLYKPGQEYPWLAQSYDWSDGGKTLTFHLRSGVTWTDGKPFTSADVAFTYNLLKKYPALNTTGVDISSVAAPDASTVVLTFPTPAYVSLFYVASVSIVSEHLWSTVADPTTFDDPNPVGTGPYTLTSFNQQGWEMTKNPSYWQAGKPSIDKIQVPIFNSPSSAQLALTQGKLDWAGIFVNNIDKAFASKDPKHFTYWQPANSTVTIMPNVAQGPLSDVAVRQAVSAAMDRKQISDAGSQGQEPPALTGTGLVLPNQDSYITPETKGYALTSDVAKAKSILEAAGYTMGGDGYYAKNGTQLSFNLEQPSNYADFMTDAQVAAAQLKEAGIKVNVDGVSVQKYTADLANGTFDAAVHTGVPGPTPFYQYDSWLNSKNTAPIGQAASSNYSRFSSPEVDKLLATYSSTNDTKVQADAINSIAKVVATQLPVIPLLYGASWSQFNTTRFTGFPSQDNPYMMPAPASPYAEYVVLQLKPVG
jgi:peptide/nickel transport system substrate-binding protein